METRHYNVDDAINYGIEKAVLLYIIRLELEHVRANKRNIYPHSDGYKYYWIRSTSASFAKLLPEMQAVSIRRWLRELEIEKQLISGNFNESKLDVTKWYTMKEFITNETTIFDNLETII